MNTYGQGKMLKGKKEHRDTTLHTRNSTKFTQKDNRLDNLQGVKCRLLQESTVWTPTHESLLRSRGGGQLGSWSHGLYRELLFSQLYQILMRLVCVCEVVVVIVIGDDIRRCDNKRQSESLFWNNVFIILSHQSKLVVPLERKLKRSIDSEVCSIIVLRRFWNSSN